MSSVVLAVRSCVRICTSRRRTTIQYAYNISVSLKLIRLMALICMLAPAVLHSFLS